MASISRTTSWPRSSSRPVRTTAAPSRANRIAVARPMPDVPPVISATLSASRIVIPPGSSASLNLLERTVAGSLVGPPSHEPGGVTEAFPLEVVVRDLDDQDGLERHERGLVAARPAARTASHPRGVDAFERAERGLERCLHRRLERADALEDLPALGRSARRGVPDEVEPPGVVVGAEQQRADAVAGLRQPVADDDAIRGAAVL